MLLPEPVPQVTILSGPSWQDTLPWDLASYELARLNCWGEMGDPSDTEQEGICRRLEEELRAFMPQGSSVLDVAPLDGSSLQKIRCVVLFNPTSDGVIAIDPDLRFVVMECDQVWRLIADSGPIGSVGCGVHLVLEDLDGDGNPEIIVSGVGCTTSLVVLFRLERDQLSRIAFPDDEDPFGGGSNLHPEDIDGDGVMEIVDEDMHPDEFSTRWIWRLEGDAYRRWKKVITNVVDGTSRVEPWGPGEW